jgi:hypothetical protein
MELTREEAEKMFAERLQEYPEVGALVADPSFEQNILNIMEFEGVPEELFPIIHTNVMVVLTFYAPLRELAQNISEDTGLTPQTAMNVAQMIDVLILSPLRDELIAFETLWYEQLALVTQAPEADPTLREGLQLRPEMGGVIPRGEVSSDTTEDSARPLTRDELLKALSAKRTMASDIQAVRAADTNTDGPVQGYEAYRAHESDDAKA